MLGIHFKAGKFQSKNLNARVAKTSLRNAQNLKHYRWSIAEKAIKQMSHILTGGKKPENWLKESCLLTGRTNTVRLFSLSVQERTTPPQLCRTPASVLEVKRDTVGAKGDRESKTGRKCQCAWLERNTANNFRDDDWSSLKFIGLCPLDNWGKYVES